MGALGAIACCVSKERKGNEMKVSKSGKKAKKKYTEMQRLFYVPVSRKEWKGIKTAFHKQGMSMSGFVTEKLVEKKREVEEEEGREMIKTMLQSVLTLTPREFEFVKKMKKVPPFRNKDYKKLGFNRPAYLSIVCRKLVKVGLLAKSKRGRYAGHYHLLREVKAWGRE